MKNLTRLLYLCNELWECENDGCSYSDDEACAVAFGEVGHMHPSDIVDAIRDAVKSHPDKIITAIEAIQKKNVKRDDEKV